MVVVLDACALIAYLTGEKGSDVVSDAICKHDCVIHALNWCEVRYDFLKRENDVQMVEEALADIRKTGIEIYEEIDAPIWRKASEIKASGFRRKIRISLADCVALALAQKLQGVLLTSDHEVAPFSDVCDMVFFRTPKLWFEPHPMIRNAMNGLIVELREEDYSTQQLADLVSRLIDEAKLLLYTGILDPEGFALAFGLTLKDADEHDESQVYSLKMGSELLRTFPSKVIVRAILVGLLAAAGYGPPIE